MVLIKRQFNNPQSDLLEKGMSALCYLSGGLIGLIYVLFSGKNARTAPFFYFHFLQPIILGISMFLFSLTGSIIKHIVISIAGLILMLLPGSTTITAFIGLAIDWLLMLINSAICILMIYGCIFALLGKYAEIPLLSGVVRRNM